MKYSYTKVDHKKRDLRGRIEILKQLVLRDILSGAALRNKKQNYYVQKLPFNSDASFRQIFPHLHVWSQNQTNCSPVLSHVEGTTFQRIDYLLRNEVMNGRIFFVKNRIHVSFKGNN
ncbi:hypothetical protein RF11_12591 [Thelohanellus kitauei]|uniref:Uncharacterized protein n=1 Tax=Thelohanellus kitauei TaxID=669202 RepID=A0A0C2M438_THEKT|nr:hypothetical protein RF11_12591 [Thelohanellus kitauei]